MFEIYLTKRAERNFAKLSDNLKQKFCKEFENLSTDIFVNPQVKNFKILNLVIAFALVVGVFYLLFSQKKNE